MQCHASGKDENNVKKNSASVLQKTMCTNTLVYNNEKQFIMNSANWLLAVKNLVHLQEIRIFDIHFSNIYLQGIELMFQSRM